jgi:hypothetical protein
MYQSIAKKDDFYVLGHPVKLRIYGDGPEAFAEISGFNLSAPLTASQLNDLADWLKSIADKVEEFERAANE